MTLLFGCLFFVALIPLFLGFSNHWRSLGITTVGVAVVSVSLYGLWGDAKGLHALTAYEQIQHTLIELQHEKTLTQAVVSERLENLQRTLPEHPLLWQRMGDIHLELTGAQSALKAYRTALSLEPTNKELMHRVLYVSSLMKQGELQLEELTLITQLLDANPNDLPALNLLAMDAYKKGNYQMALDFWEEILTLTEPQAEFERATLKKVIAQAKSALGQNIQDDSKSFDVAITVHLTLADDLNLEVAPETPVFVFVKEIEGRGVPLAVKKLSFSDLPCTITLDASHAMSQNASLAMNQNVLVGARIALSQQPLAKAGDWQGHSEHVLVTGKHELDLIIKEMI